MTLLEAKIHMRQNPGTKFTCQYFHDEWIMFDDKKLVYVFEDGYIPDIYWWGNASTWDAEWWIMK